MSEQQLISELNRMAETVDTLMVSRQMELQTLQTMKARLEELSGKPVTTGKRKGLTKEELARNQAKFLARIMKSNAGR